MKHFKDQGLKVLPTEEDLDGITSFDDLTLSSLVNTNAKLGAMAALLCDGHNNDFPYQSLPLERWRDRS